MRIAPILAAITLLAGCSSTASKPSPAPPAGPAAAATTAATSTTPAPAAPSSAAAAPGKLKLGQTATLTTPSGPLEVTAVKLVDPAKPAQTYIHPLDGHHWVGLQLRFVNRGSKAFVDTPMLGLDAADTADQPMTTFPDQDIAAGALIDPVAGLSIQPGDTLTGYLVFDLPDGAKMGRFAFAPPGGSSAEWKLG